MDLPKLSQALSKAFFENRLERPAEKEIAKSAGGSYRLEMIRHLFILLLSAAYLGHALGGASPEFYCAAMLEVCPVALADSCHEGESRDCCAHGDEEKSRPGCCFAVLENGEGWVLPSGVKAPSFTPFEWYTITPLVPRPSVVAAQVTTRFRIPDPPGLAGQALLLRVSRQLV